MYANGDTLRSLYRFGTLLTVLDMLSHGCALQSKGYTVQGMQVAAPRRAPDVPACHVHSRNRTIRYYTPAAHAVPKSWAESLQIPLVPSAGDCNAKSDDSPRQIKQGVIAAGRVHDATCCCTYWRATVHTTGMPSDPSCDVTFGTEWVKPPPPSGCRTAVLLSGKLFSGWVGAFQMSLRSVVSTLLPALPAPCIFLSMEADDADVPRLTQLLQAEPAVVAHSVEPSSGTSTSRAQAVNSCTQGAFAHLMGELGRRHAPREPPTTGAGMFRHIYLAHSMIGRYEGRYTAPTAAAVAIEYVVRARIDHYFSNHSQPPLDWTAVEAALRPRPGQPDGVILIGSMSAAKVRRRRTVGVTPAWRCFVQDFFAVGGRALMARYVAVYTTLRHSLHLMPIWRWDGDSQESEKLLTAHLHYARVPWEDIVVNVKMYFGPYGCPALHQPRRSNESVPPPRCTSQPHDSIVAKKTSVPKAAATKWDEVQRRRYREYREQWGTAQVRPERLCDVAGCASLRERLEYWPSRDARERAQSEQWQQQQRAAAAHPGSRGAVLERMHALQFPASTAACASAKLGAIYNAGFAATFHGMVSHFKQGLHDGVPVVLALGGFKQKYSPRDSRSFYYGACGGGGLECMFKPHSSCVAALAANASRVRRPIESADTDARLGFVYPSRKPDAAPAWMPSGFGGSTFEFISTVVGAHWSLKQDYERAVAARRGLLGGWPRDVEYVGVHVRRGDSCSLGYSDVRRIEQGKRQCWPLSAYAQPVLRMLERYRLKHVFVASDEPTAAAQLKQLLPADVKVEMYVSLFSHARSNTGRIEGRLASLHRGSRELRNAAIEVVTDLETLADSAALVGGFHSQVFAARCRAASHAMHSHPTHAFRRGPRRFSQLSREVRPTVLHRSFDWPSNSLTSAKALYCRT